MKRIVIVIVTAVLAAALARPAAADPLAEAREHYRRGSAHFDQGEYQQAAVEFERAHALAPSAELMFNIAQAHRLGGHCRQAVVAYQSYLAAAPQGRRVEHVHGFLAELGDCGEAPGGRAAAGEQGAPAARGVPLAPPAAPPAATVATRAAPAPGAGSRRLRLAGLVGAGAGVALLITSAWLGASASARAAELERYRGPWGDEQMELERRGRRDAHRAAIASAGGLVAVLAGGTAYLLGRRYPAAPALMPATDGAAVVWSGRF